MGEGERESVGISPQQVIRERTMTLLEASELLTNSIPVKLTSNQIPGLQDITSASQRCDNGGWRDNIGNAEFLRQHRGHNGLQLIRSHLMGCLQE